MKINENLDEGPVCNQYSLKISEQMNSEELSEALNSITSRDAAFYEKIEFFNLDSELPRWKKLLL